MKRTWFDKLRIAFYYLIRGMISADKTIQSSNSENTAGIGGIEQQEEQQNVYKDLLKGELTQEAKEFRHQMYYVDRKSHEYKYNGGGRAKKNTMFDYTGNVENSDGYKVSLVQVNKQVINGLESEGIHIEAGKINVSDELLRNGYDTSNKINTEYTIHCERDFLPRFRIERYTTKIVVKNTDKTHAIVDLYVPQYKQQFNNVSKLFQSELDRIYQGDIRSDLVILDKIWFVSKDCYGSDDLMLYEYDDVRFENIIKFDGSYVFRFCCHILTNGEDKLTDIYNEEMAKKYENKEARKDAKIDFEAAKAIQAKEELDVSEEIDLINSLKKENH